MKVQDACKGLGEKLIEEVETKERSDGMMLVKG